MVVPYSIHVTSTNSNLVVSNARAMWTTIALNIL